MREKFKRLLEEAERLNHFYRDRIEESRGRIEDALRFQEPDRVPIHVSITTWSGWYFRRYGLNIGEYFRDPELQAFYQLKERIDAFRELDYDQLEIGTTVGVMGGVVSHPSVIGCKIVFPEDDWPWIDVRYPPLDTPEKIDDFQVPQISEAGIMPHIIERYEKMEKLVGDLTKVTIYPGDGVPERPLQMAVFARGYNNLVRDMYTDPQLAHKLMRKMCDVGEAIHDFYGDLGLGGGLSEIETADLYDNFPCHFSPSLLRKFVLPYYFEWAENYGWKHWTVSSQGILDPYVKIMTETPTKCISYLTGFSNLKLFKETFTPRRVWIRVAYEASLLLNQTPQEIDEECKRIIEIMGPGGGFMMSTAILDWGTPEENIHAFIEASKKHGRY
ncbi:MAG: uroporphyrinogen decarboxylase family protein [Candidatus Bathyarchaeia archaeon]